MNSLGKVVHAGGMHHRTDRQGQNAPQPDQANVVDPLIQAAVNPPIAVQDINPLAAWLPVANNDGIAEALAELNVVPAAIAADNNYELAAIEPPVLAPVNVADLLVAVGPQNPGEPPVPGA